jgi:hypothetical protein
MTTKQRTGPAAAEPSAKKRKTRVAKADTTPVEEPPRTDPCTVEEAESLSAHSPETLAIGSPSINETEAAALNEAPVATVAMTPTPLPEQPDSPANKLSALDAAAKVLGETGQAMSCPELIAAMAAKGYWSSPKGRTPAGTLYSGILRELQTRGDKARFSKYERGKFRFNTAR